MFGPSTPFTKTVFQCTSIWCLKKFKAKCRNEARCSGVNVEDSKLERQRGGNKGCLFHQQTEGWSRSRCRWGNQKKGMPGTQGDQEMEGKSRKRNQIQAPVQDTGRNVGNDHCYLTPFVYNVRQIKPISDISSFLIFFFFTHLHQKLILCHISVEACYCISRIAQTR